MTDLPKRVDITEKGPREGFQIEPGPIETNDKASLINALAKTGLKHIETVSFVSARRVPGMADAEAVVEAIAPVPGVKFSALWFNARGLERALATGKLHIEGKITLYASEKFLERNLNRTPEEHLAEINSTLELCKKLGVPVKRGAIAAAFGCNFGHDVPPDHVTSLVDQIFDIAKQHKVAIETITLADTMAWATPLAIKKVVGKVRAKYPDLAINLHLHDTRGMGLSNAFAGPGNGGCEV
jgi:hydroxymethylglutaryl-CoA lyase